MDQTSHFLTILDEFDIFGTFTKNQQNTDQLHLGPLATFSGECVLGGMNSYARKCHVWSIERNGYTNPDECFMYF